MVGVFERRTRNGSRPRVTQPQDGLLSSVFTDSFTRADQILQDNINWFRIGGASGTLQIRSNQAAALATTQTLFVSPDLGAVNHYVEVTMASVGASGPFVAARAIDGNSFVGVTQNDTNYKLFKAVGNVFTELGTVSSPTAIGDRIRVEASGDLVSVYLNGVISISNVSLGGELQTSTRTGLVARSVVRNPWVDDYKAGIL